MVAKSKTLEELVPGLYASPEEKRKRAERMIALLDSFENDYDEQEMKETGEHLMKYLAETRESNRKPEEK